MLFFNVFKNLLLLNPYNLLKVRNGFFYKTLFSIQTQTHLIRFTKLNRKL